MSEEYYGTVGILKKTAIFPFYSPFVLYKPDLPDFIKLSLARPSVTQVLGPKGQRCRVAFRSGRTANSLGLWLSGLTVPKIFFWVVRSVLEMQRSIIQSLRVFF